jgi:hypothetical protein
LFFAFGPNSGLGTSPVLILFEKQVDYVVQAILKIQRERLKSIEVKKAAVDDFDEYLEVSIQYQFIVTVVFILTPFDM